MTKRKSEELNVKPRTKRAKRILEKREPKLVRPSGAQNFLASSRPSRRRPSSCSVSAENVVQLPYPVLLQVEDVKTALLLHGPRTSQITKDVLADIHKLRTVSLPQSTLASSNFPVHPFPEQHVAAQAMYNVPAMS